MYLVCPPVPAIKYESQNSGTFSIFETVGIKRVGEIYAIGGAAVNLTC